MSSMTHAHPTWCAPRVCKPGDPTTEHLEAPLTWKVAADDARWGCREPPIGHVAIVTHGVAGVITLDRSIDLVRGGLRARSETLLAHSRTRRVAAPPGCVVVPLRVCRTTSEFSRTRRRLDAYQLRQLLEENVMIATVRIGTLVDAPPVVVRAEHMDPFVTLTIGAQTACLTRDEARRIGDALRACGLTDVDDDYEGIDQLGLEA